MSHPLDPQRRQYHRQIHSNAFFVPMRERHHDSIWSLIAQAAAEAAPTGPTLHALKTEFFSRQQNFRKNPN